METESSTWGIINAAPFSFKINSCLDSLLKQDPIEEKIEKMAELKPGWHFGEGNPPSKQVIKQAQRVYRTGRNLMLEADVFPAIDGGIVIVFYGANEYSVEIEINAYNNFCVSYEKGYGFNYKQIKYIEKATMEDIRGICQTLSLLNLSDSFTQNFLIQGGGVSSVPVSVIPQATEEFPLLIETASDKPVSHYVSI